MQTDRASAFVVDSVKICLTSSLIMQNLVVLSHTVCTHVGPKNFGALHGDPPPWDGRGNAPETRYCMPSVFSINEN